MFNFNHPVVIFAQSQDGVFGIDSRLPWKNHADMKWFAGMTKKNAVIMGRKTFESLPGRDTLPDRVNIVVTRNKNFHAPGAVVVGSLQDAMRHVMRNHPDATAYVIGGVSLIKEALQYARRAYVSTVDVNVINDSNKDKVLMAPTIDRPHSVERSILLNESRRRREGESQATVQFIDLLGPARSVFA